MKRCGRAALGNSVALALTWDGARWPIRSLPAKARTFLGCGGRSAPSAATMRQLFAEDGVRELRICWVPRLKGGSEVLSEPYFSSTGKRVAFRTTTTIRFGDVLGVVYRR